MNTADQHADQHANLQADPLFDPQQPADAELQRLQSLLAPYGAVARGLHLRTPVAKETRRPAARGWWVWLWRPLLATAVCALLLGCGLWYRLSWTEGRAWQMQIVQGTQLSAPAAELATGAQVQTSADQSLTISVARIGALRVSPQSSLSLLETRAGQHRVQLQHGHLRARIWAPPGHFGVSIGGAEVIDLGCAFDLWRGANGSGRVLVSSGWIAYRHGGDEVLVPAGYQLRFDGRQRWTPLRPQATAAFAEALDALERALDAPDSAVLADAAARLAERAEDADGYTLLTLLSEHPQLAAGPLYPRLAQALGVAPTDHQHRRDWQAGKPAAINRWWQHLPNSPKQWWWNWADAWGWAGD